MEVKAKLPTGKWLWPAIWLLPKNNVYGKGKDGTLPPSGEIDLIEVRGHPKSINDNIMGAHMSDHRISESQFGLFSDQNKGEHLNDTFHVYGLIWTKNRI
jgi:beta-glucanase (GH16 family)